MPKSFSFPNLTSLADVDMADVESDSECVVTDGVISPSGQGAYCRDLDGYRVHIFSLAAWREPHSSVDQNKLTLLRPVPIATAYKIGCGGNVND